MAADGLVNHTYEGLAQGVSEQATEARRETQVEEMENCIPHISRGILRRNPVDFVAQLKDKDGVQLSVDDYYIYTYDRGTADEQYLVLLGHRKWFVFNANTGALKGSYNDTTNAATNLDYLDTNGLHPKDVFSIVTVGDYTWISNSQVTTAMDATIQDDFPEDYHRTTAVYWIKSTGNVVTATNPTTGAATIEGYEYNIKAATESGTVVGGTASGALRGDEVANNLTVQLNGGNTAGTVVTRTQGPLYSYGNYGWTTWGTTVTIQWAGKVIYQGVDPGATYTSGKYTYIKGASVYLEFRKVSRTWDEEQSVASTKGLWKTEGPFVYKVGVPIQDDIEWSDSFGNNASFGMKGIVSASDRLPETLPKGLGSVIVKVDGSSGDSTGDEYWLEWTGDTWVETREPGLVNFIDPTTMPHTLLRKEDGSFVFGYYGEFQYNELEAATVKIKSSLWNERIKGDMSSAPEPGFIGKKISNLFIHNNRLGILAEDAVVLSELSIYGNFWPTTIRSIPSTDPIDLIVATTDVTGLKKAVSLSGLLLLMSDDAQFSLSGGGGALTPESATISPVSSYNYSNKAPARVVGNKVYFTTESGNGTQHFAFRVNDISSGYGNIAADMISLHVPTYLPTNVRYLQGHSILGYLFMFSEDDPNTIFVLNTLDINNQNAQTAYHKWVFNKPIKGISVIDNQLGIVFNDANKLIYTTLSLDIPADHTSVNYTDDFDDTRTDEFTSKVILSKWFVKDANGIGTRRGRLQIRTAQFTTDYLDKYKVSVVNDSVVNPVPTDSSWILLGGTWDDTGVWEDDAIWTDNIPYFERVYYNDEKITVSSNADTTYIIFSSNENEPSKGFALSTVNMEGMWRQRSQRF